MSIVRPASDLQTTGWTAEPGPAFFTSVDEVSANDADYVSSPVLGATVLKLGLDTPFPAGTHDVRFRASTSSGNASVRVRLLDSFGDSVGFSEFQLIDSTPTTYELPVTTTGEAAAFALEVGGELPGNVLSSDADPLSLDDAYLSFWLLPEGAVHLGDDPVSLLDDFVSFIS